jgi:hypothetical protein
VQTQTTGKELLSGVVLVAAAAEPLFDSALTSAWSTWFFRYSAVVDFVDGLVSLAKVKGQCLCGSGRCGAG